MAVVRSRRPRTRVSSFVSSSSSTVPSCPAETHDGLRLLAGIEKRKAAVTQRRAASRKGAGRTLGAFRVADPSSAAHRGLASSRHHLDISISTSRHLVVWRLLRIVSRAYARINRVLVLEKRRTNAIGISGLRTSLEVFMVQRVKQKTVHRREIKTQRPPLSQPPSLLFLFSSFSRARGFLRPPRLLGKTKGVWMAASGPPNPDNGGR